MKRCPESLATREIPIRTTMRHHITKMSTIKRQIISNVGDCEEIRTIIYWWYKFKIGSSSKIKHRVIIYDQEISLLGIYSREIKTYAHTKTCI